MPLAESPTERGKEKDQKVDDIERKKTEKQKKRKTTLPIALNYEMYETGEEM